MSHRVAVVVFADVDCEHADEAEVVAEDALAHMFSPYPVEVDSGRVWADGKTHPIRVIDVRGLGSTMANGFIKATPSNRAWRNRGLDDGPSQQAEA